MEEQVVQKKKSNGGLIIAFIIILLIAVAGSSFGGYVFGKADGEKNTEVKETEAVDLKEADVQVLMDRIDTMNNNIAKLYPISDVKTIPNQDLLSIALSLNFTSADEVEKTIRSVIGDNVTVKHEDYLCNNDHYALMKYSNGWYSYNNDHPGHGGGGGYTATAFFKSATLKDDTLVIDTNLLYDYNGDTEGPNESYYDSMGENKKEVLHNIEKTSLKAEYEKIKDTLPTTTYTFKQNAAGLYNLESVVIK